MSARRHRFQCFASYIKGMKMLPLILVLFCFTEKSQTTKPAACDCNKAIPLTIKDSLCIKVPNPNCAGEQELDSKSYAVVNTYAFDKEHYTAWFKLKILNCGILMFTVTPKKKTDDYDFMLFKQKGDISCNDIKLSLNGLIRSNISRTDSLEGITGLNNVAKTNFTSKGINPRFSKAVEVKAGDEFMLVLDNVYGTGSGFELQLYIIVPPLFILNAVDASTKKKLKSDFYCSDSRGELFLGQYEKEHAQYYFTQIPRLVSAFKTGLSYIVVAKDGYIPVVYEREKIICENNNDSVKLKQLVKNGDGTLTRIYFQPDLTVDVVQSAFAINTYKKFLIKPIPGLKLLFTGVNASGINSDEDKIKALKNFIKLMGWDTRATVKLDNLAPVIENNTVSFKVL